VLSLFLASLILGAIPVTSNCETERAAECRELLRLVYRSADSPVGAVRMIDGARWDTWAHSLAYVGNMRVLIVGHIKDQAGHAESGRWSAYYFETRAGRPRLAASFLDFQSSGSFGYGGDGTLALLDGVTPAWILEGGGTWQGHSCLWVSIDVLGPQAPRPLLHSILSSAHEPNAPHPLDARLVSPLSEYDMVIEFERGPRRWRVVLQPDASGRLVARRERAPTAC